MAHRCTKKSRRAKVTCVTLKHNGTRKYNQRQSALRTLPDLGKQQACRHGARYHSGVFHIGASRLKPAAMLALSPCDAVTLAEGFSPQARFAPKLQCTAQTASISNVVYFTHLTTCLRLYPWHEPSLEMPRQHSCFVCEIYQKRTRSRINELRVKR